MIMTLLEIRMPENQQNKVDGRSRGQLGHPASLSQANGAVSWLEPG